MPKIKVRTAQSELKQFTFEWPHGTTSRFFQTGVAAIMEVRKGSKMEIEMASLRRIDPMPLPPMSIVKFNTRYFYVPMIDICPYYNELDANTPYTFRYGQASSNFTSEIPLKVPQIRTLDIKLLFFGGLHIQLVNNAVDIVQGENPYLIAIGNNNDPNNVPERYDIRMHVGPASTQVNHYVYFRFKHRGRNLYKLLKQCGYDFAVTAKDRFNVGFDANNAQSDTFSALPLLAYVKVYLNFYESSQYINNTERLARLNSLLHIDKPDYKLDKTDIDLIADLTMYTIYDEDYFTTSFVNPANGNNFLNNNENINIKDNTSDENDRVNENTLGTPILQTHGNITDHGITLLKRLTNYLRRHQVAGGRMVDRILAEYGVSIENSYSRRSSYIDTITSVMNITPVINTTSDQLGDFAGFGTSRNEFEKSKVTINVPDQDGFVIAIDTVIPEVMYSQGYRRLTRHITKFDFVAGTDFDAIGTQAIEQGEIIMCKEGVNYHNDENPTALSFGFTPRGAEYKMAYGYLTGDFIVNSVNLDTDGYFTDRRFDPLYYRDADNKINITTGHSFVSTYDSGQYRRIFYTLNDEDQGTDYIKSIFRFRVKLMAPYKALYDEYRLEDLNGNKEINMKVGGQEMN